MADLSRPNNNLFVPPQYSSTFDFTPFEHGIFMILPSSLLIIIFPILLYYYARKPILAGYGWLLFAKIASALCLLCFEIGILILRIKDTNTITLSVIASSLSCGAALCTAVILGVEHCHSPQPSLALSLYFGLTALCEITLIRPCIKQRDLDLGTLPVLLAIKATLRGVLLLLQEKSRRGRINFPNLWNSSRAEITSGFWTRPFFVWLDKILFIGFRKVLELDDLDELEPQLLTAHLDREFSSVWAQTRKDTPHCLAKACSISLARPALAFIIPRLCFTAFTFCQPLLLWRVTSFLNEETDNTFFSHVHRLIGATVIIYLGIAISRVLYTRRIFRFITSIRGILVSQILKKSLTLEHSEASRNAAMALISIEVESVISTLPRVFEFTISLIEVGVGIFVLYTVIRNAALLIFTTFLLSIIVARYIGRRISPATMRWNEQIQHRISQTTLVIRNIISIKMLGLDSQIIKYIQNLRVEEIKASHRFRTLGTITLIIVNYCVSVTPVVVLAGAIFLSSLERLTAVAAFTTLSATLLVSEPLSTIISGYTSFRMTLACIQRIQIFLLKEEWKDSRTLIQSRPSLREYHNEDPEGSAYLNRNAPLVGIGNDVIQAHQISIKDHLTDLYLLQNASFSIRQSTLTIIVGAPGSGKSLLLRTILGEVEFEGSLSLIDTGVMAYCDQTPWICNTSIRDNIIGDTADINDAWYEMVVEACLLTDDFLQLPEGDETFAGSEGVGLSGGQKQRVALARAIYSRAAILILDDPLSRLDQHTSQGIESNLFGPNGILHSLRTTVIMVSHSAFCAALADSIISLDGAGNLTTTEIIRGSMQSQQLINTIFDEVALAAGARVDNNARKNARDEKEAETLEKEKAEQLQLSEAQEDTLRRKGNLTLYLFYIKSVKRWVFVLWFVIAILTSLSQSIPTAYVRIWLEMDPDNNLYFIGFALLGLLHCILTAFSVWFYFIHVVTDSGSSLHEKLLDTMMRATLSYLTETDSGVIISRFSQDITLITRNLPRFALLLVDEVINITFMGIFVLSGARFVVGFLPLILIILYVFQHFYLRTSQQIRYLGLEAKTPLYTHLAETAAGICHIRSYRGLTEALDTGLELLDESQKPVFHMSCMGQWLNLGMDITVLGIAVILVSFTLFQNKTSQTAIGLALASLSHLGRHLSLIIDSWTSIETSLGAIARIRDFERDTPTERETGGQAPQDWPKQGHIVLSNVTAVYSSIDVPNEVLSDVSIEITPGQKVGVIGRTGSGKSSLLLAILNFLEYTGTIFIDGRDISTVPQRLLRSQITIITQTPLELDASVRYNLLPFQLERIDEKNRFYDADVVEILCRVRLWAHITTHGGLDTKITNMAFSSGQLQILSIARAILHHRFTESKIVVMDEPTSNIDLHNDNDAHIQDVLYEAFQSCTVLTVSHCYETLLYSDMILEMSEGQVIRFSPPPRTTRSMSSFRDSRSMSSFR